jgi:hypothetical protein
MKHPTQEEWMSYLYDELSAKPRTSLESHLAACVECRAQLQVWQGAAREMNQWRMPARRRLARPTTFLRWAAAAAVIGLVALGGVRFVALNNEVKQLRAEVGHVSQRDSDGAALAEASAAAAKSAGIEAQALISALAERMEGLRLADQQAMLAALQKLNARHTEDFASMRKELETVAVFTEAGLQRTQTQLANLAYSPGALSNTKQD